MKQETSKLLLCIILLSVLSCSKKVDKPNNETEHEAINKIEIIFNEPMEAIKTIVAEDPDGDGGSPPSRIDTISLTKGKQYSTQVKLFNISNGIIKEVTSTILSQATSHELFFIPTGTTGIILKTDKDKNGYPVGFQSTWQFQNTGSGSLLFKLMHKTALKGSNDGPNVGHSDIQISLPLIIK